MKITFCSNYFNHHQQFFCNHLFEISDEFYFVETDEKNQQGYQTRIDAEYVIQYYGNEATVEQIIIESDVVIFGACPNKLIELRMSKNKLAFLYSERFLKLGLWRRFIPHTRDTIVDRVVKYSDKRLFILCASAYLPYDLSLFGFPTEKCFKWGYFPKLIVQSNIENLIQKKHKNSIIWVARLIKLKHPEYVIQLAKKLRNLDIYFEINIVGDGNLRQYLEHSIKKNKLEKNVRLLGSKSHDEVRVLMEQSQIFIFTSDRREGWGAVMNEAMNAGCTTVASHIIGSVPYLIEDGVTGYWYRNGDINDLTNKVVFLLKNPEKCMTIGVQAYKRLMQEWSPKIAAERFVELSNKIELGEECGYSNGVCSRATLIDEKWNSTPNIDR